MIQSALANLKTSVNELDAIARHARTFCTRPSLLVMQTNWCM